MSELEKYVDELFAGYQKNRRTEDLKAEILTNLEAKKADLVSAGLCEAEAAQKAKESITSVDFLMDDSVRVYYGRMKLEFVQRSLIVVLLGWILTIPLLLFRIGPVANIILFLAVAAVGIYYLRLQRQSNRAGFMAETRFIRAGRYEKRRKIIWLIWAAFAAICTVATTALYFGSNIWFAREVHIDGPYAFASVVIAYFTPLLSVIIPIIAGIPVRLTQKYEAGENDEA